MPVSSPLALLSILAAASELENRGGSWGLVRGVLEKNRGDGGVRLSMDGPLKFESLYALRLGLADLLGLFNGGSLAEADLAPSVEVPRGFVVVSMRGALGVLN